MFRSSGIGAAVMAVALAALACNVPFLAPTAPPAVATLGQLYTAAAQTLQAGTAPVATATPTKPVWFPTLPGGTATRIPPAVTACDAARFIRDVTIPDGTSVEPGDGFTKTWRIANVGACTWTPSYALVFTGGDRMHGAGSINLPDSVSPGQTIDLSVRLTAPDNNGVYQGYWMLRNAAGALFGIGAQARGPFWVKIEVAGPTHVAYDFARRYCDAVWENGRRELPCPGQEGEAKGYVIEIEDAILENGNAQDDAALLTVPRAVTDGFISGKFPAVRIQEGDHFQARVNCAYRSAGCNVIFSLSYQIGGGTIKNLGRWNEAYEGKYYPVDVDLSSLAGSNVRFILTVSTNGPFYQDRAMWVGAAIVRRGSAPAPSSTPASTPTWTPTSTPTFTPTATQTSTSTPTGTATETATP